MPSYKTPGVYVQEISKLPASIAPVATAIPAFIGYTEKHALKNGEDVKNSPVRLQSLLEYEEIFGGPFNEKFKVTLSGALPDIAVAPDPGLSPYLLYYQLQVYFANGGGPCYVVSVGDYSSSAIGKDDLAGGVNACEKEDEITLLAVPEAMALNDAGRKEVYDKLLAQCARLQDRFAIMDVEADPADTVFNDGANFRNNHVGPDNLKYGAAYYPALRASIPYHYTDGNIDIDASAASSPEIEIFHGQTLFGVENGKKEDGTELGAKAVWKITITNADDLAGDSFVINGKSFVEGTPEFTITPGDNDATAAGLALGLGSDPDVTDDFDIAVSSNVITLTAKRPGEWANAVSMEFIDDANDGGAKVEIDVAGINGANKALYNAIKKALDKNKPLLYPCGAIAGVYARVDRERGVWKAPANVSLSGFEAPSILVTHEEQENLNVDPTSGKSINAIRTFAGKGILVWGARTLAGNDNEWRYVPVRRLYIFVEESVKKATEFVVFEPNDAKTWSRVKAMIGNFLTGLWREGALAGAAPSDAFFVKVGLGETMTTDDILNGIMNIEIGMAAVRPAEFIILKFSHKLQES